MKIKVKLIGESNKVGKEIRKNIQLRFMDICRFMLFTLDKLASNLDDDQCEHLKELYEGELQFLQFLILWGKKMYIYMSTWMAKRNFNRQTFHQKTVL